MSSKWMIIGISGVTCGGKTTLTQRLAQHFTDCVTMDQDQYFRLEEDPNHEWVDVSPGVRHQNWESMASMDWQAMTNAINDIIAKEPPKSSDYPALLIVDGFLIFNYKPISDVFYKKFFITIDKDECLRRRTERAYLPPDPNGYFESWVWPMYLKNRHLMNDCQNDVPIEYLDGSLDKDIIFETVLENINQLLSQQTKL
ncbi:nicotinamide riboside kinase 1-like [Oppia nitens]|uniref:nicotinamide riboside kinase 1-like n=1 Tax=Oppia nitens TaxID=1686743 RepID=UPI0023DA251E|nr:nicotinamide riboside kinase 1-like [Oppia nitens]